MSLSVASNAAGYGRPLAFLPAVVPTADATQQAGAAAAWSYVPPSVGSGRYDARLSDSTAVLSRLPVGPNATATASTSSMVPARSDAAIPLQALKDTGGAPAATAPLPQRQGSPASDRWSVQAAAWRPATNVMPKVGSSRQDVDADPSLSATDAQLQALFKTLQEYGL